MMLALAAILTLTSCGTSSSGSEPVAWLPDVTPTPTLAPVVDPVSTPSAAQGGANPVTLSDAERRRIQPNELGAIPVVMYHGFTTKEEYLDDWTLTPDMFLEQIQWLYDHDFYITPLADLIDNEISVPAGKHPVVLTFDDATAGQFKLLEDDDGTFYPDPETAVGVLEGFIAEHPDFGRGGLFSIVPNNCFNYEGQVATCEQRLIWLAEHGYEMANHTWWHENLQVVSNELLFQQVGDTKIWLDERVPGDANLSNVLVLPFGAWPDNDEQIGYLLNGFRYEGQDIGLVAFVEVGAGPSPSPSSGDWTRRSIPRFNSDPGAWAMWTERFENGEVTLYTSDGNPATVTVPNELPDDIAGQWDPEWASSYGMEVIRYDLSENATSSTTPDLANVRHRRATRSFRSRYRVVAPPA